MNSFLLLFFSSQKNSEETSESSGTMEKLLQLFKNPVFYIVLGAIVAVLILVYLLTRFVKPQSGRAVVITRKGKIKRIINEADKAYYRIPFVDSIGATITLKGNEFTSDKLFINDGPDHLYRFNYALIYDVTNPELFYEHITGIQENVEKQINDALRLFADSGNSMSLINEYRSQEKVILGVITRVIAQFGIEASSFKVNYIEPIGR